MRIELLTLKLFVSVFEEQSLSKAADRERIGKPPAGRLVLSAEQQGNRILITLKDDGCGIDLRMLRAVAIQRRVASAAEIERWSPEQVLDVIFQPGFSTRSSATDVSGRGVGMDVVKSVVERLGGTVRVQSELDKVNAFLRDSRNGDQVQMDPQLFDVLWHVQRSLGTDGPYQVLSAYRSPETNAWLASASRGVASDSLHMRGQAMDVKLPGFSPYQIREAARALGLGGVGYYPRSGFVHLDTGPVRYW